jgi:hypothetical protein
LSQLLTLYTTPVIYLGFDRLGRWMFGPSQAPVRGDEGELEPGVEPEIT